MKRDHQASELNFEAPQNVYTEIEDRQMADSASGVLRVVIPYTNPELTRAALRHAGVCTDLNMRVSLIDIQVIGFPCPLDQPPIRKEFSEQRLRDLFEPTRLPGTTRILYTRDWLEGFRRVLEPHSIVIVAAKKRWWRTREEKLAQTLLKAGHDVMLLHI
jgi:hypothetical protein